MNEYNFELEDPIFDFYFIIIAKLKKKTTRFSQSDIMKRGLKSNGRQS